MKYLIYAAMAKLFIKMALICLLLYPAGGFAAQGKNTEAPVVKQEMRYSANVKTKKYHNPRCRFYDCRDCAKFFKSPSAAKKAGYEPCGKCGG